jgi:Fur family ferric uptake transcriptional regulator
VGEATVYRTIRLLCDAGILQETLHSSEGRPVFELAEQDHHDHIVCGDCGEVFEFQSDALERLQSQIAKRLQFGISAHRHVLVGRCEWKNRQENQSR